MEEGSTLCSSHVRRLEALMVRQCRSTLASIGRTTYQVPPRAETYIHLVLAPASF